MIEWIVGLCAAAAAALVTPPRRKLTGIRPLKGEPPERAPRDWMHRWRLALACLAGIAGWIWVPSRFGAVVAVLAGVLVWVAIGRAEPAGQRRARLGAQAELPHLIALLAATLRSGSSPEAGLAAVCAALPGPAADRLATVRARLALGADPGSAWAELAEDPVLGPLGRTLARSHTTGASVTESVAGLAGELAADNRARVEDRARAVGVRAALPLGLCLLPAFLVLGIVPVVAGLLASLTES